MVEAPKKGRKLLELLDIEQGVQKLWKRDKIFQQDAPKNQNDDVKAKEYTGKYFCSFPYPYMNGVMHLGHAFTVSKVEFAAKYQRLNGKQVLFPFGFHCTGIPISACANKLRDEIKEFGYPPQFPKIEVDARKAHLDKLANKGKKQKVNKNKQNKLNQAKNKGKNQQKNKGGKKDANKKNNKKNANKQDNKKDANKKDNKKDTKKKDNKKDANKKNNKPKEEEKVKKEDLPKRQFWIMKDMGIPESEIKQFVDPLFWVRYFPPTAKNHLLKFGLGADFRRSFITTEENPYYDSFIRWQFNQLKKKDKIKYGKRECVFSIKMNQPVTDHDRSKGEGATPQEYTCIKLVLQKPYPKTLADCKALEGKKIVLPAATLRPETMCGQTNVWILPKGEYGVYETDQKDEVFVTSARSALNMSYQEKLSVQYQEPTSLVQIKGKELLGFKCKAPLTPLESVYILPLPSISMGKGTGIVTSVPSDAPHDYCSLYQLKHDEEHREKYGITKEMVENLNVIPIIKIPNYGEAAAEFVCKRDNVTDVAQDAELNELKKEVYKQGFNFGVMNIGKCKGMKVSLAKDVIQQDLVKSGEAMIYFETEEYVESRVGDECVVALAEQWYLDYGEEQWKTIVEKYIDNELETFTPAAKAKFQFTINWLKSKGCSRTFGLGTKIPWDEQFLIESLSDSTIYFAYYTVAHFLQNNTLNGRVDDPKIHWKEMNDKVWSYLLLGEEFPKDSKIPKETLEAMKAEFDYWYPLDLRCSGKDLIQNHLTMALYNHAAIWDKDTSKWPKAYWTNGFAMLNGEKMSKSSGNFMTIIDTVDKYGADATRFACADAGDSLEDANFSEAVANSAVVKIHKELTWIKQSLDSIDTLRDGDLTFIDTVFENSMNGLIGKWVEAMDSMFFRQALQQCYHEFTSIRDNYRASSHTGLHKDLVQRWIECFVIMNSPFTAHTCQHLWEVLGKKGYVVDARIPEYKEEDLTLTASGAYMDAIGKLIRTNRQLKKNAKKDAELTLYVTNDYHQWQKDVAALLEGEYKDGFEKSVGGKIAKLLKQAVHKTQVKLAMRWANKKKGMAEVHGKSQLVLKSLFDVKAFLEKYTDVLIRGTRIIKVDIKYAKGTKHESTATIDTPVIEFIFKDAPPKKED